MRAPLETPHRGSVNQASSSSIFRLTYVALGAATVAGAIAGLHLTLLSGDTETTFAWHIRNPLTAAFFGASYVTAGIAVSLALLRARRWEELRSPAVVTAVFITVAGVITLRHAGEFQCDSDEPAARFVSWGWLVLYLGLPIPLLASVVRQERARSAASYTVDEPLFRRFRAAFTLTGALLLLLGMGMLLDQETIVDLWPWPLPPLSARIAGAWVFITGMTLLWWALENDWAKLRTHAIASLVFYPLQLIAAVRFHDRLDWDEARTWIYIGALLSLCALQAAACLAHLRRERRTTR